MSRHIVQNALAIHMLMALVSLAHAQVPAAPTNFADSRNGLVIQSLGTTCFSFDIGADTLPCNPAYVALQQTQTIKLIVFGDNNISNLGDAVALAKGNGQSSNVKNLFSSQTGSEADAKIEAAYLNHDFALSYEPFGVSYFSVFRNPALPQITLYASLEKSVRMQLASLVIDDVYVGLQFRYLDRQVIATQFFLTDLLAENGTQLLNPQDEQFYFLEPGFIYAPKSEFWNPQVTFNLINLGWRTERAFPADPTPAAHLGASISPSVGLGQWGWALDLQASPSVPKSIDAFTLGSFYQLGILKVLGNISALSDGLGFSVLYEHLDLGISYTSTVQTLDANNSLTDRRVYFLLGAQL